MTTFKELKALLDRSIAWEEQLNDLYDVAQLGLRNPDSRRLIDFLKERQDSNLEVLRNIELKKFGPVEWVKYARDYRDEDMVPKRTINRDSKPEEIFTTILEYEEKLKEFYQAIAENVVSDRQKDLFESLVTFKEGQISRINNFIKAEM